MKICHVTTTHSRIDSRVFKRQCLTLKDNGHEVLYVCCDGKPEEFISGVKVISFTPNKINKYKRYGQLFFCRKFTNFLIEQNSDIYQVHDLELLEVGYRLAKRGHKVIFDSHENWYGMLSDHFPKFGPVIELFLNRLYKRVLPSFSCIFSVSPNMVADLAKYNSKTYMVPNFPQIKGKLKDDSKNIKIDNKFIYQGTVYTISNQESTIEAFQETDYKYIVIGNVEEVYKQKLLKLDHHNKVEFVGWTPPEKLAGITKSCLAGLVILDYDPVCCGKEGQLGSNKIFEYMMSGLPVICTNFSLWKELIIDKYKCGICVPPRDPNAIKSALDYIVNNKEEAAEMGRRGQDAIWEEFNWEKGINDYLNLYKMVLMS